MKAKKSEELFHECIKVAIDHFPIRKMMNGQEPNFARAVRRIWKNTETAWVFHLEDDWLFTKEINIDAILGSIHNQIKYIRFPKVGAAKLDKVACQPSLWKGDLVRSLSEVMINDKDPEKQLRKGSVSTLVDDLLPTAAERSDWPNGPYCDDNGREWRAKRKLQKWNKNNSKVITWN